MAVSVRCLGCGDVLPALSERVKEHEVKMGRTYTTCDNKPATRGPYGDGLACSLQCAQLIMVRVFSSAAENGWDLRDLLPEEWRPDLIPKAAWQAGVKLKGKRTFVVGRKR